MTRAARTDDDAERRSSKPGVAPRRRRSVAPVERSRAPQGGSRSRLARVAALTGCDPVNAVEWAGQTEKATAGREPSVRTSPSKHRLTSDALRPARAGLRLFWTHRSRAAPAPPLSSFAQRDNATTSMQSVALPRSRSAPRDTATPATCGVPSRSDALITSLPDSWVEHGWRLRTYAKPQYSATDENRRSLARRGTVSTRPDRMPIRASPARRAGALSGR
jgi:hypothetical protein